jgi:hypothetical protein
MSVAAVVMVLAKWEQCSRQEYERSAGENEMGGKMGTWVVRDESENRSARDESENRSVRDESKNQSARDESENQSARENTSRKLAQKLRKDKPWHGRRIGRRSVGQKGAREKRKEGPELPSNGLPMPSTGPDMRVYIEKVENKYYMQE